MVYLNRHFIELFVFEGALVINIHFTLLFKNTKECVYEIFNLNSIFLSRISVITYLEALAFFSLFLSLFCQQPLEASFFLEILRE